MRNLHKRKLRRKKQEGKGFFFDSKEIATKLPPDSKRVKKKKKDEVYDCNTCPLDKGKNHVPGIWLPNAVLFLGRDPGVTEVQKGYPFCGMSGQFLRSTAYGVGVRIADSQYKTQAGAYPVASVDNIVSCRPPNNDFNKDAYRCCYSNLEEKLHKYNPRAIVTLGREATERILGFCDSIEAFNAIPVPSHRYKCIVIPMFHPAYIKRMNNYLLEMDYKRWFSTHSSWLNDGDSAEIAKKFLDLHFLDFRTREIQNLDHLHKVAQFIKKAGVFSLDFENNTAKVYTEGSRLYMAALATWVKIGKSKTMFPFGWWIRMDESYGTWTDSERSEVEDVLIDLCTDPTLVKVIQNSKHEDHCLTEFIGCELAEPVYCTMVNRHILNSRPRICSLRTQALQAFGINYKFKTDPKLEVRRGEKFNRIHEISVKELGERCATDAVVTLGLKQIQAEEFKYRRNYNFFDDERNSPLEKICVPFYARGIKTFTKYERRGIKIDIERLLHLKSEWSERAKKAEEKILKMATVKKYANSLPKPFNLNSKPQLRKLLFDKRYFGLEPMEGAVTKKTSVPQVTEEVLKFLAEKQNNLFSSLLIERDKYNKLVNTYVTNIELYIGADGRLHHDLWLHTVSSYRSSSSKPNMQNMPKHYSLASDAEAVELRSVFIPSYPDWELREVDYGGNEVRGLWMLCRDGQLLEDINNGLDMHTYWASQLYQKPEEEVDKLTERFLAKNKFVFRTFYGGPAEAAAKDLDLDVDLVRDCQRRLYERYPRMKEWQEKLVEEYKDEGYVKLLTGFMVEGPLDREQIINIPIQGTSFHKVLHSCNEVEELKGFDTIAVNQVHDSILFDGPKSEREKHTKAVSDIMINLPWDWSKGIVEEVEWEAGPNWKDMEEYAVIKRKNE